MRLIFKTIPKHFSKVLLLALCALTFAFGLAKDVDAQIVSSARVELSDLNTQIFIGQNSYLTTKNASVVDAQTISSRYKSNLKGTRQSQNIVHLGAAQGSAWLLFSVTNASSDPDWVLDFGTLFEGRFSSFTTLKVYNANTKEMLLDTSLSSDERIDTQFKNAVHLSIPLDETHLIAVYFEKGASLLNTVAPSMYKAANMQNLRGDTPKIASLFWIFILVLSGFFAALFALKKDIKFGLFTLYFVACGLFLYAQSQIVFMSGFYSGYLILFFFVVPFIVSVFLTQRFLGLDIGQDFTNLILYVSAGLIGAGVVLKMITLNSVMRADDYLFFVPLILNSALLGILSLSQTQFEKHGSGCMALGWFLNIALNS